MKSVGLKRVLHIITILAILGIVIGYSYLKMREMLLGPSLSISTPVNGLTVSDPILNISGQAKNVQVISINGREIFIDEQGNFEEIHLLYTGYNSIVLHAKDRFDKEIKKKLEIIYLPHTT